MFIYLILDKSIAVITKSKNFINFISLKPLYLSNKNTKSLIT